MVQPKKKFKMNTDILFRILRIKAIINGKKYNTKKINCTIIPVEKLSMNKLYLPTHPLNNKAKTKIP